jgi:hypothetical protein
MNSQGNKAKYETQNFETTWKKCRRNAAECWMAIGQGKDFF